MLYDGDTWICRRDETIRLPYRDIIHHTHDGIPYLAPELVLLFKAKHGTPWLPIVSSVGRPCLP